MRALVTGCAGFIGSHLTEFLLDQGVSVVGLDCFNDNYGRSQKLRNLDRATDSDAFEFVPIDLARGDLTEFVSDADVIFHLAAEPGVRSSWGGRFDDYLRNNVLATQHLLEASRATPDKRFVFASSSSVYGEAECFPTSETTLPRPFSPYGVTKLAAENLCTLYRANHGVDAVCLRYFTVYGPRQRPDMAFHRFCRSALRGEAVTVLGDGEQTRDFTFVADIVRATWSAARLQEVRAPVINIGGGSRVTVNEVVAHVEEVAARSLEVKYLAREAGDVRDTCADPRLAREQLGFEPQTDWREGVRAEFEWLAQADSYGGARTV